jgi:hypothetical protein
MRKFENVSKNQYYFFNVHVLLVVVVVEVGVVDVIVVGAEKRIKN